MAPATPPTDRRDSSTQLDHTWIRHQRLRAFALVGLSGWMLAGVVTLRFLDDRSFLPGLIVLLVMTIGHAVGMVTVPALSKSTPNRTREFAAVSLGTAELLDGAVPVGAVVPGRVVHLARVPPTASGLLGGPRGPAVLQVIMEVLPPDAPPRRISVLAPTEESVMAPGSVHAVALHPGRDSVGVLDGGFDLGQRAALAADPRWASAVLPTDRSLTGGRRGQLQLLAFGLLGQATTFIAGLIIVWLVNAVAARLVG